jgi:hypothetical protein
MARFRDMISITLRHAHGQLRQDAHSPSSKLNPARHGAREHEEMITDEADSELYGYCKIIFVKSTTTKRHVMMIPLDDL